MQAPPEYEPLLKLFFTVSYVLLAAFVGAFADSMPKWRVMFISNTYQDRGCVADVLHGPSAGGLRRCRLGAAAYSPAKYGILTEYLPARLLVVANGWIEGTHRRRHHPGHAVGGMLIKPAFARPCWASIFPLIDTGIDTVPEMALVRDRRALRDRGPVQPQGAGHRRRSQSR
jgi:LPLT family lysophospholipid transporter-like MFS transporter